MSWEDIRLVDNHNARAYIYIDCRVYYLWNGDYSEIFLSSIIYWTHTHTHKNNHLVGKLLGRRKPANVKKIFVSRDKN